MSMTTATPKLGGDFHRLWLASLATNLGDGVALAAGPLLVAGLTRDPALVGMAVFVQQLPWLLLSLFSGALVDRLDRRRLVVVVNLVRAVVLGALTGAIATGHVSIPVVYAAFFLLGTAETLADTASGALVPAVVPVEALPAANARLMGVHLLGNQFAGPPLGAAIFVFSAALPFGVNAATFLIGALLVRGVRHRAVPPDPAGRRPMRQEIAEGVRWLLAHRLLRMFFVCLFFMNLTLMATVSIMVLYATERLGLPAIGFGLLTTVMAVGGLLGTVLASRLVRRFGESPLMRVGLLVETATHFVLAGTRSAWVVGVVLFVFGVHGVVWGTIIAAVRQRVVPDRLRGRVGSVSMLLSIGGSALGSLGGGLLAKVFGLTAPFWTAGAAMVVLTAVAWRGFGPAAFREQAPGNPVADTQYPGGTDVDPAITGESPEERACAPPGERPQ
ncbi:putative MFS family arabinose efflux permease [Actinokineospora spheciospongiae]|nr:putative MFS family arabinose efflux permease [Actinokineospora spheciospongiae]